METVRKKRKKRRNYKKKQILKKFQVNDLKSLINIIEENKQFENINMNLLYQLYKPLKELDAMVGMQKCKNTIFKQLLYYIQNIHIKDGDYLHTVILGPPGCGKCLGYNTPIRMFNGDIKYSQDIKIGDKIMGDDSTVRNVLQISKGCERLYKIIQKHGMNYIVNRSHILTLKNSNDEVIDISLQNYLKTKLKSYNGFKKSIIYPKKKTPINPYLFGIWLGCSVKNDNILEIPNIDILYILHMKIKNTDIILKNIEDYKYKIISDSFNQFLKEFNLNADNKYIPKIFKINSIYTRLTLLQGIKDSDNPLEDLKDDIEFLIDSTNIYDKLSTLKIKKLEIGDYYGFVIDGNRRFMLKDGTITHNTTLATILGQIYSKLDILKGNIFKKVTRDDFVAGYVGQTALKTKALLKSCVNGVLFIDEVYSFGAKMNDYDSFSKEAVDTLNEFLSENKNNFCCIIAGYEEDVKKYFFNINKGLERRFQWVHRIESYNSKELSEILVKMVKKKEWDIIITEKTLIKIIEDNIKLFNGLAGDMENLFNKSKLEHAKRVFGLDQRHKFVLLKEDIENAIENLKKNKLFLKEDKFPSNLYI